MEKETAIRLLKQEGKTLVIYGQKEEKTFTARGVSPLLSLLDGGEDYHGFCAADKVVGKAAAFLYIALGIRYVYAITVSASALQLLKEAGIAVEYENVVPRILNRSGTGFCPMESAVLSENDLASAIESIRTALSILQK